MIQKSIFLIFILHVAAISPSTGFPRPTQQSAGSFLRFEDITYDYIAQLEAEYRQKIAESIERGITQDYIDIGPRDLFLIDLELLRTQCEKANNIWLQVLIETTTEKINNNNYLLTQLSRSPENDQEVFRIKQETETLLKNMPEIVQIYIQEFNQVYKRCNWLLIYNQPANKFILIDTLAPEYQSILQEFAPEYNQRTSQASMTDLTDIPTPKIPTYAPSRNISPRRSARLSPRALDREEIDRSSIQSSHHSTPISRRSAQQSPAHREVTTQHSQRSTSPSLPVPSMATLSYQPAPSQTAPKRAAGMMRRIQLQRPTILPGQYLNITPKE